MPGTGTGSRRSIAIEGLELEVMDLPGDPAMAPVVLLHEGLGSVGLWREFPNALAQATGARVIAFSRFGHGASALPPRPRTPRFMHEEAREILPQVLEELDADEPVLVGHSDGASIALIYAASHPVRGVVAIAPHVFVEAICLAEIRQIRELYSGGLRERMARHHRDPDAAFFGWNDVWLHPEFPEWNIEDVLPAIDRPVLLIQGIDDQYGTMEQLDRIERAVRGPVERVPLRARHHPHVEAPDETLQAVARFVLRVGGIKAADSDQATSRSSSSD